MVHRVYGKGAPFELGMETFLTRAKHFQFYEQKKLPQIRNPLFWSWDGGFKGRKWKSGAEGEGNGTVWCRKIEIQLSYRKKDCF